MNKFKITPKKEINRVLIYRSLYCFVLAITALSIISIVTAGQIFTFKHVIIMSLCGGIPLAIIYTYIVEKLGGTFGGLLLGWTGRKIPPREEHSADLAKARFSKTKGQFKEALILVNGVIEKDPKFSEALFLKAQVVWEGYGNKELALRNLDKIIEQGQDDEPVHRWAVNYYHEIIKTRRD